MIIKLKQGHWGEACFNTTGVLLDPETCGGKMKWTTLREASLLQARRKLRAHPCCVSSEGTDSSDLDFLDSNSFLLFKSLHVWYLVTDALKLIQALQEGKF